MSIDFEELDYQRTALGELVLRRRREPKLAGKLVFEVKLGDEFLMSNLFTAGEIALADLGLSGLPATALDIVIGGLGLGYTAAAALQHTSVASVTVIEALPAVIDWHRRGLVPLGTEIAQDPRCHLLAGDFFALFSKPRLALDAGAPSRFHAVLLDIDHSPRHLLHPDNATFYTASGLRRLAAHLQPRGRFALWSNDPPDEDFTRTLESVFDSARANVVTFDNPYTGGESTNTVYVASLP